MTGIGSDIIEACKKGNRIAQNKLYKQYCDAMFNICLRMLKNQVDAEDVLQLTFCDVFRKLDQYRMESSIGAWIKRITINNCLDFLKKRNLIDEWDDKYEAVADETPEDNDSYDVESIRRAINQLPTGYRVSLTLYLFEGLDHAEIADYLGISVSTSKTQYHRAKKKLLELMKNENV